MYLNQPNAHMNLNQVASQGAIVGTRVKPVDRVYNSFASCDELAQRVISRADEICGPQALLAKDAGQPPSPAGIANEMADCADRSHALAREAMSALNRIAEVFK